MHRKADHAAAKAEGMSPQEDILACHQGIILRAACSRFAADENSCSCSVKQFVIMVEIPPLEPLLHRPVMVLVVVIEPVPKKYLRNKTQERVGCFFVEFVEKLSHLAAKFDHRTSGRQQGEGPALAVGSRWCTDPEVDQVVQDFDRYRLVSVIAA